MRLPGYLSYAFYRMLLYLIYLQLPVMFDECTPEQQKQIRLMRLPKGASKTKEEFVATFDPLKYL